MSTEVWNTHQWFTADAVSGVTSLDLDYAAGHIAPPFEPIEDDQGTRNDVTAERPRGSSSRIVATTGPLSTLPPPDGVGRYDESVTVNVETDEQLADQAAWRVHLGTVDEPRYPTVTVDLTSNPDLMIAVAGIESGDRLTVANTPVWLPPGDVETIVQGYGERLTPFEWRWEANTSPGPPWDVTVLDDQRRRVDTAGSELATAITSTQTTFDVVTTAVYPWIDSVGKPTHFPFDVKVGGEVMTVTDITGTSSPQTFTVTRSVNGVVKPHDAGSAVNVDRPAVLAL